MGMTVQILSFGSAWWTRPGSDLKDPLRYTRHAAYFNSAAIAVGTKLHTAGPVAGLVRFNHSSGLDLRRTDTNIGRVFAFGPLERYRDTNRLLALSRAEEGTIPTHFLVRLNSSRHGLVSLRTRWCSADVQTIAVSRFRGIQELLLLMTSDSEVRTQIGTWSVRPDGQQVSRLTLMVEELASDRGEDRS